LRRLLALAVLLLAAGCASQPQFLERSVTVGERPYRFRVWLPPHYTKVHHWPVVLYLHGSAERGDDNIRQVSSGIAPSLQRYGERYHCVVVLPQCAYGREWYGEMEQMALAALEAAILEFHGDRRRVVITGNSMGGSGAWYLARHRKRFSAVVPVCGEVVRQRDDPFPTDPPPDIALIVGSPNPYATLAAQIGKTPVWAFHGALDDVVPVTQSRSMVAALRAIGGNVRYTEYPDGGHEIWDRVYGDAVLTRWMLAQRLR
jgi:predicted peptidase